MGLAPHVSTSLLFFGPAGLPRPADRADTSSSRIRHFSLVGIWLLDGTDSNQTLTGVESSASGCCQLHTLCTCAGQRACLQQQAHEGQLVVLSTAQKMCSLAASCRMTNMQLLSLCCRFDAATGDVRYHMHPTTQLRIPYCPQVRCRNSACWSSKVLTSRTCRAVQECCLAAAVKGRPLAALMLCSGHPACHPRAPTHLLLLLPACAGCFPACSPH